MQRVSVEWFDSVQRTVPVDELAFGGVVLKVLALQGQVARLNTKSEERRLNVLVWCFAHWGMKYSTSFGSSPTKKEMSTR